MEKEVVIQSIKILMGKREFELSIEEAKKLKKALEAIFDTKVIEKTEHIHHHDWYRHYDWNRFYVTNATPTKFDFGDVYCSTAKGVNSQLCLDIQ